MRHLKLERKAFLCLLIGLAAWKLLRMDWAVSVPYWHYDPKLPTSETTQLETFPLPVSPLWHPPQPSDFGPSVKTWRDASFIHGGGTAGPTEEPRLHPNWLLLLLKLAFGLLTGKLLIVFAVYVFLPIYQRLIHRSLAL
ncbi:MAG: hypothetical protein JWO89_3773 [Verrucomicrobiaceae bacterium]|nr:hypothetical protein [Verrucomicrobiaceae bacterium]